MKPRTPTKDILLHNSKSIVRRLDWEEWRKSMNFQSPPKTAAQIEMDTLARASVKDIRDNRDPGKLGRELLEYHARNPQDQMTLAEWADELSR